MRDSAPSSKRRQDVAATHSGRKMSANLEIDMVLWNDPSVATEYARPMSDCLNEAVITALREGRLSPEDAASAEDHLNACDICRQELENQPLFDEVLRAAQFVPPDDVNSSSAVASDTRLCEVDGYEILDEIHRGGQGVVYRAVQKATNRNAALKVVLHGAFASPRQKRRFEREIDLAAKLRHPNIVTIYDSGPSQEGPYLAMEYIEGLPLNKYLHQRPQDRHAAADLRRNLQLFHTICLAVSFAHQRGVIHRDLKPDNILVDTDGEPHILDFGLAKTIDFESPEDRTMLTKTGEFLGTLAYASPEQTKGDPQLIDVRTDVYSLGIILYEMLTYSFPYDVDRSLGEVLQNICEAQPEKPSLTNKSVRDELDTIVLKALAKSPERRYQSAEQFGSDIAHFLAGEPIDAKRDSHWYLLKKSLQRYRVAVGVVVGFVALLATALAVSLILWNETIQERDRATLAEEDATKALAREAVERDKAEFGMYVASLAASEAAIQKFQIAEAVRLLGRPAERFRDWEWRHLLSQVDRSRRTVSLGAAGVKCMLVSPDGTRVLSGGQDGNFRILSTDDLEEVAVTNLGAEVVAIDVCTSTADMAVALMDGTVKILNESAYVKGVLEVGIPMRDVSFSADGKHLAIATVSGDDDDGRIQIWDVGTGELAQTIPAHDHDVQAIDFAPHGERVASASINAKIWDRSTGELLITMPHTGTWVRGIRYSPDGRTIATASDDGLVRLWQAETGDLRATMSGHLTAVDELAFTEDGRMLATGSDDSTVRIWDVETGELVDVFWGHAHIVNGVGFVGNSTLLSASWTGWMKVWDLENAQRSVSSTGHRSRVNAIAVSPDGRLIASASFDEDVILWDALSLEQSQILRKHQGPVTDVAFSEDGNVVVSTSADATIRVWNLTTKKSRRLTGHSGPINSLAFVSNTGEFLTASVDATVRLWHIDHRETTHTFNFDGPVSTVAVDPEGRLMATCEESRVRIWDLRERTVLQEWEYPSGNRRRQFLTFHPSEPWILAPTPNSSFTVWNTQSGDVICKLYHEDWVESADFNPSGTRLVTASRDRTVRLWNIDRQEPVLMLRDIRGHVNSVRFSRDGNRIVGGRNDGKVQLWGSVIQ